jgi:glycosyltransferase involved in cell wall biosynthesis
MTGLEASAGDGSGKPEFKPYHAEYARSLRQELSRRAGPKYETIVCCTWGGAQIEATRELAQLVVESSIGYRHTWAKYRVFESYAWMHFHYGKEQKFGGNAWYDAVIPGHLDPADFGCLDASGRPVAKQDYLMFLGRLNDDKGVAIAVDVAKRVGRPILLVGTGDPARFLKGNPHARHVPAVGREDRRRLLAEAAGLLCPTQYIEPFGNIAIEAAASGTPVISTDWGAFPETVLHGHTGYRCRTMEQFVWAASNLHRIDPATCRQWARDNFSLDRASRMYDEYFRGLLNLNHRGWYEENPARTELDWLTRRFPAPGK